MGKIKRSARAATRADTAAHTKPSEDYAADSLASKRPATRRLPGAGAGDEKLAMPATDDGILDEWLEPDEDADLDQWLHEHGGDAGRADRER